MRHAKRINHLGRTDAHRKAMLSNMATSLIMHKRINTTLAKAKELRKYVEPMVTRSKNDTTHSRRMVFALLHNKYAVTAFCITSMPSRNFSARSPRRLLTVPAVTPASSRLASARETTLRCV